MIGCVTAEDRIGRAAEREARAGLAGTAFEQGAQLPPMPADCRARERTGVTEAMSADEIALRSDAAVGRANRRVARCYAWYGKLRAARQGGST